MTNLNISAEAITKRTKKENRHVWEEVERGKYRIVYASPEVILSKRGYFFESLVRNHNKFMEDLVAVAVDEAHLIWDWVGFRDKYQLLGTLRNILNNVPWVLLSATLSPMVAAYVHEVCNLRPRTMRFIMSCRRDNINLAVCPIKSHDDLNPLLDLIRPETRDFLSIPKTIIFHDGIEGGQRIADALRARLPSELSAARDPHETIQMFFGSIDEKTKKKTLSDLESGKCRIVICTDAFGLGVDISNIERVIQWGVDEKISISSLTQRIGRAARNPFWIGQAIIYVHKAILEAVSSDWEAGWEPKESSEWVDVGSDDDDSPRVIPISKMRRLERFGIPVTEETRSKVSLFIRNIYTEAKSVKEANRIARREIKGTTKAKLTAAQKVDPAVLWVLCTVGCRHRAILSIYKDEMAFDLAHRSWCCDRCAKALTDQSQVHSDTLKSQLRKDAELLDSTAAFLRTDPTSCKIILISNRHIVTQNAERFEIPRLPVCKERRVLLKSRLYAVRYKWWKLLNLPSFTTPQMILPDDVIEHLIQSVRRIHCQYSLERELQAARFDVASSLMPSNLVPILYQLIDKVLCSSAHLETGMEPSMILYKCFDADCRSPTTCRSSARALSARGRCSRLSATARCAHRT